METLGLESFEGLLAEAAQFRDQRDWAQFHTPKNLAAAIAIEAAELQEVLLWQSDSSTLDPGLCSASTLPGSADRT